LERGITEIKSVNEAKPLQRIVFLSAGAIANLLMALILFMAVGMLGVTGSRLNVVAIDSDSIFVQDDLLNGDVIESINGEYFLDSSAFFEKLAAHDGDTVEIIVRRGEEGEIVPLTIPASDFTDSTTDVLVRIMGVVPDTPASEAGILPGDIALELNQEPITSVSHFIALVGENAGSEVSLTLLRDGNRTDVNLVPRADPPPGEGAMGIEIRGALYNLDAGLIFQPLPQQVIVKLSPGESLEYSVQRFGEIMTTIVQVPAQLFRGNISPSEARPVSIVGISQVGGVFLQQSIQEERPVVILNYIAIISIALGLTNLLPLPSLDGGRILFVLIEMIRGRPIPPEREGIVHLLGLVFLLSLTVIVIVNDIINPVTDLIP
jgi:regulator of sigma E protease